MALPTLDKTWEFKTNWFVYGGYSDDTWAQYCMCDIKDLLCDFVPRAGAYAVGSFTFSTPTVTYTAPDNRFTATAVGNLVGKTVRIVGATTAGNDGDFTITAQTSNTLQWSNASGAAEALAGSLNVLAGEFTAPWTLSHTGNTSGHGTKDDGIDRLAGDPTLLGGGSTGTVGYWVLHNEATDTWWSYSSDSNTTAVGDRAGKGVIRSAQAPNELLVPASNGDPPQGTLLPDGSTRGHHEWSDYTQWWLYDVGLATPITKLNVMMSTDGQQTRLFLCDNGYITLTWIDAIVRNPSSEWAVGGGVPTPAITSMYCPNNPIAHTWTIGVLNDAQNLRASGLPWNHTGLSPTYDTLRHDMPFYVSGEGFGSQLVTEYVTGVNTLTGAYDLFPWGLTCYSLGVQGRHGEIPDIWWIGTDATQGDTYPDSTSRQFLCLGDVVVPWNGDILERQ
jgi:hypothetical protein